MIKKFDDGSYLELRKIDDKNIVISLCSIDPNNSKIISVTSVSLELNDLKTMIEAI
jgi:hypothetical protein